VTSVHEGATNFVIDFGGTDYLKELGRTGRNFLFYGWGRTANRFRKNGIPARVKQRKAGNWLGARMCRMFLLGGSHIGAPAVWPCIRASNFREAYTGWAFSLRGGTVRMETAPKCALGYKIRVIGFKERGEADRRNSSAS